MKANEKNFRLLCRCYYEFTGDSSIFSPGWAFYGLTFIQAFWALRNEIKQLIKAGEVCRYSMYQNGQKLPFIVNSLQL